MKKTSKYIGIAAALAVLTAGGAAFARPDGMPKGMPGMAFLRMLGDLDLTEAQELQAVRARRLVRDEMKEAHEATAASMGRVIAELEKPAPDAGAIHGVADEALGRLQKIVHLAIDQYLALHATFSPEQRQQVAAQAKEMNERRARFKEWKKLDKAERSKGR